MRGLLWLAVPISLGVAFALGHASADGDALVPSGPASLRTALAQGDRLERAHRFYGVLESLSPSNVASAREALEAWQAWLSEEELRDFMIAWARFDAPAALEWALSRPGAFREDAGPAALEGWAFHDPSAAREALESLPEALSPALFEEHLVAGWLRGGRTEGVIEYIEAVDSDVRRQRYTSLLTIDLMRAGPDAVIRWAHAIPDDARPGYKAMAFEKAGNILASVDPARAAHWIEAQLGSDHEGRALLAIGRRWLEVDPAAAMNWLDGIASSAAGERAFRATFSVWQQQSPHDAERWARGRAPTPHLDFAVRSMVGQHEATPELALDWARRLHDRVERSRSTIQIARAWRRSDPGAVEAWLAEQALPKGMDEAIRNGPSDRVKARPSRGRP